jgi:hypothetical protein
VGGQIKKVVIANERSECGNLTNTLIYMSYVDHPTYALRASGGKPQAKGPVSRSPKGVGASKFRTHNANAFALFKNTIMANEHGECGKPS